MSKSKISVIIPFSNTDKYIGRCIVSVLSQTLTQFEVILIDDHSTDNSRDIIKKLTDSDNRFRIIELSEHGLSAARNLGIEKAAGKYLFFLDSDDWIENDCLFELFSLTERENSQVSLLNFDVVDDKRHQVKTKIKIPNLPQKALAGDETLILLLNGRLTHYAWSMLLNRKFLLEKKISFPVGRLYEDFATTYKIFAQADKVSFLNRTMYHYVQHDHSITHTVRIQDAKDIIITIAEIDTYFDASKFNPVLIVKYQLPRLFIAYRIVCTSSEIKGKLNKEIYRSIVKKARQKSLFKQLSLRNKLKITLLRSGILKLIYKVL